MESTLEVGHWVDWAYNHPHSAMWHVHSMAIILLNTSILINAHKIHMLQYVHNIGLKLFVPKRYNMVLIKYLHVSVYGKACN